MNIIINKISYSIKIYIYPCQVENGNCHKKELSRGMCVVSSEQKTKTKNTYLPIYNQYHHHTIQKHSYIQIVNHVITISIYYTI